MTPENLTSLSTDTTVRLYRIFRERQVLIQSILKELLAAAATAKAPAVVALGRFQNILVSYHEIKSDPILLKTLVPPQEKHYPAAPRIIQRLFRINTYSEVASANYHVLSHHLVAVSPLAIQ